MDAKEGREKIVMGLEMCVRQKLRCILMVNLSHCQSWFSREMKSLVLIRRALQSLQQSAASSGQLSHPCGINRCRSRLRVLALTVTFVIVFSVFFLGLDTHTCVSMLVMWVCAYILYPPSVCLGVWICSCPFYPFGPSPSGIHILKLLVVHSCKSYWFSSSSFLAGSIPVQDNACEHAAENQGTSPFDDFSFRGFHKKRH